MCTLGESIGALRKLSINCDLVFAYNFKTYFIYGISK